MVTKEQIENAFSYHQPKGAKVQLHIDIREAAKQLAYTILAATPTSREQSLAITKLEEVMMWANAAIARH